MNVSRVTKRSGSVAIWHVAVCFLLAGLFLYNPFLAIHDHGSDLTVCHPTSHRATVGASELEQFSQQDGLAHPLPDVDLEQISIDLTTAIAPAERYLGNRETLVPQQASFSSSLWFRPPPAA